MYTWYQERIHFSYCLVLHPPPNTELYNLTHFVACVLSISIFLLDGMGKLQSLILAPLSAVAWNKIVSTNHFYH